MKELIKRHLTRNYKITLNSYTSFKLYDIATKEDKYLRSVMDDTIELLGINEDEFEEAWSEWIELGILEFENTIVDLQYKIYEKTGLSINLHEPQYRDVIKTIADSDTKIELGDGILEQIRKHNTHNYG